MMTETMEDDDFCCSHFRDAATYPPHSFFRNENGVTILAVGFARTLEGPAFYDQAILYCPFCGSQLHTAQEVAAQRMQR